MKTEMQQLKENTEREKARETLTELAEYMDKLIKLMREGHELHIRSASYEFASMFFSILTIFTGPEWVHAVAFNLFLFVMFRNWVLIYPKVHRASQEYDGCITTLEILGMIDKNKGNRRRRKSKRYRRSYFEAYWNWLKNKKRQEAFA
jgi:hypothetical protein